MINEQTEKSDKSRPTAENDNEAPGRLISPRGLYKRCRNYFRNKIDPVADYICATRPYKAFKKLEDSKFFPKFMAAKGGFSSIFLGIALLPAALYHGTIIGAVVLTSCILGLVTFGAYGMLRYGGHLFNEGRDLVRTRLLGKPPLPSKKAAVTKTENLPPPKNIWGMLRQMRMARAMQDTKMAEIVRQSPVFQKVQNHKLLQGFGKLGRDQDVMMRVFATGGALTTIAVSAVFMASQALTISALTLSAAGLLMLYTAGNLVAGVIAFGTHGFHLFDSSKKALKSQSPENPVTKPKDSDMNMLKTKRLTLKMGKSQAAFNETAVKAQNDNQKGKRPRPTGGKKNAPKR